jgi:hypothetical protein
MKLAWGARVSESFRQRVLAIADGFGWSDDLASGLMACMHFESGGTFSPTTVNAAGSGAIGLIQFMPATAAGLGTSSRALAQMSAVEQLDWVERYFRPYAHRIASLPDMYMAILLPSAIGKPDDAALFSNGAAYRQNAALDADSDGRITKAEAAHRVQVALENGSRPENAAEVARPAPGQASPAQPKEEPPMDSLSTSILTTAIPALWNAIPEIASIFKKPDVAARNVEAVQKVGQILIDSTSAANAQDAITKVQTDPAAAQAANDAIRMSRADIMDILDRVNDQEQKNIAAARVYNTGEPMFLEFGWMRMRFVHFLSIVFVAFVGVFVSIHWSDLNAELKGAIVTLMMLPAWGGVRDYWMGSSDGSARKTDAILGRK